MNPSAPRIVVLDAETLDLPENEWQSLRATGELFLYDATPHDPDLILQRCAGAEIILTNKAPLGEDVVARLPSLRLICVLATGYNIIAAEAARHRQVTVCNVPGYSTTSVAQHTLALMLELANRVGEHSHAVACGDWQKSKHFFFYHRPIVELAGRTVGIFGLGEIGRAVARRALAFDAHVLAYRRSGPLANWPEDFPVPATLQWADSPEQMFVESDFLSLHCPLTPETQDLVHAGTLALMKPTAFLINTARGGLVVESDLAEALRSGVIAGAALDVLRAEPMRLDCPLAGEIPNLILTPHHAWASPESRRRLLRETEKNITAFLAGAPRNQVN